MCGLSLALTTSINGFIFQAEFNTVGKQLVTPVIHLLKVLYDAGFKKILDHKKDSIIVSCPKIIIKSNATTAEGS